MTGIPVVAIDGPSGAGKGTITRLIAERLGWRLLDSGALYRVLALAAAERDIASDDDESLAALARTLDVRFETATDGGERILLDGVAVTRQVRSEECGNAASRVAVLPAVRTALVGLQRAFCKPPGLVADGRDMGTVIFPDAACKVFLTASVEERARRRHKQLNEKGLGGSLDRLFQEIAERDERDVSRPVSPLVPASDAVVVDTTGRGIEEVVEEVMALVRARVPSIRP